MSLSPQILSSGFCTVAQFFNVNSDLVLLNMLQLPSSISFSVYNRQSSHDLFYHYIIYIRLINLWCNPQQTPNSGKT